MNTFNWPQLSDKAVKIPPQHAKWERWVSSILLYWCTSYGCFPVNVWLQLWTKFWYRQNCKVWPRNVVKWGKYIHAKFANFVLICITRGKMHHFRPKCVAFFRCLTPSQFPWTFLANLSKLRTDLPKQNSYYHSIEMSLIKVCDYIVNLLWGLKTVLHCRNLFD
jgi:hypothetical protein